MSTTIYDATVGSMSDETETKQIGIRVEKALYQKLVDEQTRAKKHSGYEPSISDIVRTLIEKGLEANGKRR